MPRRKQMEAFKVKQMTIRIRTDVDERVIEDCKTWARRGSASSALMKAARVVPALEKERDELAWELDSIKRRLQLIVHRRGELEGAKERYEEALRQCL